MTSSTWAVLHYPIYRCEHHEATPSPWKDGHEEGQSPPQLAATHLAEPHVILPNRFQREGALSLTGLDIPVGPKWG